MTLHWKTCDEELHCMNHHYAYMVKEINHLELTININVGPVFKYVI